jgi:hypothetical protein
MFRQVQCIPLWENPTVFKLDDSIEQQKRTGGKQEITRQQKQRIWENTKTNKWTQRGLKTPKWNREHLK